jgi:UPF0042 nucleotide-binding protein
MALRIKNGPMAEFLIVSGMSGAGRSTASTVLEDLGWFVIDNLPPALFGRVGELVNTAAEEDQRIALVLGRGGRDQIAQFPGAFDELVQAHHEVRVLFLDAPDDVLIRRFEGTRRRHPHGGQTVEQAVSEERTWLEPLRQRADVVLDTGDLNANQLKSRIREAFAGESEHQAIRLSLVTFGFKNGLPLDADLVFDLRFLPNPYWEEDLRPLSGLDAQISDWVLVHDEAKTFVDAVAALIKQLLPGYLREGKSYLTVALGCTGGRHRSVSIAEKLMTTLAELGASASVFHRDIDRP